MRHKHLEDKSTVGALRLGIRTTLCIVDLLTYNFSTKSADSIFYIFIYLLLPENEYAVFSFNGR